MIVVAISEKELKKSKYYNNECWDYPFEELDYLRENQDNNIEVYALTEKNRIYETTCTVDEIKNL